MKIDLVSIINEATLFKVNIERKKQRVIKDEFLDVMKLYYTIWYNTIWYNFCPTKCVRLVRELKAQEWCLYTFIWEIENCGLIWYNYYRVFGVFSECTQCQGTTYQAAPCSSTQDTICIGQFSHTKPLNIITS